MISLHKIYKFIKNLYSNNNKYNSKSKQKILIGIGGGGSNIVEYIDNLYQNQFNSMIINSDLNALNSKNIETKLLLNKTDNYGCGANASCGLQLIDDIVLSDIAKFIDNRDDVNIIVTLGGGVGSGSTKAIIKYLNTKKINIKIFVVYPFSWEGIKRMNRATDTVKFIKKYDINLHEFYNDDLKKYGKTSMKKCFNILNKDIYNLLNIEV